MGKVQHLGNAVDHGVAKGNDGVDRADADAVDQVLNNFHDCPSLSSSFTQQSMKAPSANEVFIDC